MSSFKKLNLNGINRLQAFYRGVEANVEGPLSILKSCKPKLTISKLSKVDLLATCT
jgi:hypothetical protein